MTLFATLFEKYRVGVLLSASGEHAYRYRRMRKVLRAASQIAAREAASDLENSVIKMEDHEGNLLVTWASPPTAAQIYAFGRAWETAGNELAMNVEHWHDGSRRSPRP